MALEFPGGGTQYVNLGSASNLDDIGVGSVLIWLWIDTLPTATRTWYAKSGDFSATNEHWIDVASLYIKGKNATNRTSAADRDFMETGKWLCAGYEYDASQVSNFQNLYKGTLTTPITAVTMDFNERSVSSSDASFDLLIGNSGTADSNSFDGKIAMFALWSGVRLTESEFRQQQFSLTPVIRQSNLVAFINFGWNGTSTQPDWSGNLNNGTVTGATVADHVPLGYFSPPKANVLGPDSNVSIDISESNYNAWIPGVKVRG